MTNDLQFRPVTSDDMSIVNDLMRQGKGYWGYPEDGLDRFINTFGIKDSSYFNEAFGSIAYRGQEVIGYYLFKMEDGQPMLDHFFLNVDYIGQGFGRILWDHCILEAKTKNWTEFTFWSDPYSQPFYEKMGAIKVSERPMVTIPGFTAPIMKYSF